MKNNKTAYQPYQEQYQLELLMQFVTDAFRYKQPYCPSCKKKILEPGQVGRVAMIEDHTVYLLCKKCLDHATYLHTRRNNGRVNRRPQRYIFLCLADIDGISWRKLMWLYNSVPHEVIPYA